MAYTIAFFGTKPYDESSFTDKNKEFGFEIRYYKGHLNKNNVLLTQGVDAVCIFVNDIADAEVLRIMASNGVKLLALRCAGFNNVDLEEAKKTYSEIGKFFSCKTFNTVRPTTPVAPTTASLYFFK